MHLNKELIEHLAYLSRLNLTEGEKETYLKDFSSILAYVEKIQPLIVKESNSLMSQEKTGEWRQDQAEPINNDEKKDIIDLFPQKEESLLKVKGVFE